VFDALNPFKYLNSFCEFVFVHRRPEQLLVYLFEYLRTLGSVSNELINYLTRPGSIPVRDSFLRRVLINLRVVFLTILPGERQEILDSAFLRGLTQLAV
jgi:hypothetical protein